jgi:dethiobiotin synthetase
MGGLFVLGTDTEVGKTVLAASICARLGRENTRVAAFKPVVTGLSEPPQEFSHDHRLLSSVATCGQTPEQVAPYRFTHAVSPHYAAELEERPIDVSLLLESARAQAAAADVLVCEGVGGLMVPLADTYTVCDFACDLGFPVLIAAKPTLGTINHTLLSVSCAHAMGLDVAAVVLGRWRSRPQGIELSNKETIAALAHVPVYTLPEISPTQLHTAADHLPLRQWLATSSSKMPGGSRAE